MLIHWIVDGVSLDASGTPTASLATNRYRAILPAKGLASRGHSVKLIPMQTWVEPAFEQLGKGVPDIVVIGKLLPRLQSDGGRYERLGTAVISAIEKVRASGARVLADVNDDYFRDAKRGGYLRSLVTIVDGVVAGSPTMAHVVKHYSSEKSLFVVGDPLGAPHGDPMVFRRSESWITRFLGLMLPGHWLQQRIRLVWYGNAPNWPNMSVWSNRLAEFAREQPLHLQIVTQPEIGVEEFASNFNSRFSPAAFMEFIPWKEDTVWDVVAGSHIVLIPSDLEDSSKSVKTANRLTDALNRGRLVVASPVPAYSAYTDCAWLGEDLVEGIRWAIDHPGEALDCIRRGQEKVVQRCSVDAIAASWEEAFLRLLGKGSDAAVVTADSKTKPAISGYQPAVESTQAVKLNLGCGDKLLEGYINVDVAPSRRGFPPDVLCDLRDLVSFASDSADEILSVHVVEHFWRWEVLNILREWVRVLKPGGKMILECPNLVSACQALLSDPENASEGDTRGQRSMWVFYGDPSWQDPLMTHRWAYTPNSLASLMRESGLVDVRQEPAQFKLREPRDMRVVGTKP